LSSALDQVINIQAAAHKLVPLFISTDEAVEKQRSRKSHRGANRAHHGVKRFVLVSQDPRPTPDKRHGRNQALPELKHLRAPRAYRKPFAGRLALC
jgi:hypothetical protein